MGQKISRADTAMPEELLRKIAEEWASSTR